MEEMGAMCTYEEKEAVLREIIEKSLLEVLAEEPSFSQEGVGRYYYEVPPIPGDRLSEAEYRMAAVSDLPERVLQELIGSRYGDAIFAAEQSLFAYCCAAVEAAGLNIPPQAVQCVFLEIIEIHAPVSYYKKQLQSVLCRQENA